jgi:hypothetical protein
MEHSYFNLMLYLFQEDCKQSWSPQHTYDTRQDNTTDYLTLIIGINAFFPEFIDV